MQLTVFDETTTGERRAGPTLDFLTERVTARELIRSRVYQEVTEHNARQQMGKPRLVEPAPEERSLNGEGRATGKRVDWERQFELALRAFEGNGFLLFAGDRQLLDLDEEIEVQPETDVTFLRLVPLVGG
ncbi:MAG: hypothetical protein R3A46_18250 [Thermomicrobiales bacterium]